MGVTRNFWLLFLFLFNISSLAQVDTAWVRSYNGPVNGYDQANALAVDDSGNVYVTGMGDGIYDSTSWEPCLIESNYTTIKYAPNGDTLWVRRYHRPGNGLGEAKALAVDHSGNVYVTGFPATIKYFPNGDTAWVRISGAAGIAIAVDESGNVYVTGGSEIYPMSDYATIKYVQFTCLAKTGDVNNDDQILLSDIVAIINFLFKAQPAPNPVCRADADADGKILLSDIVYLINFLFKTGPAPQKSRECCL